jgi:hypothetical protein
MLSIDMAQAKTKTNKPKKPAAKAPTPKPTRADGRRKSLLSLAGEEASLRAKRELLLKTLDGCGWNLSAAADALKMPGASQVIRSIRETGLDSEYEAAKQRRA